MKHETEKTYRKLKHVDPMSFGKDIEESLNHLVMDRAPSIDIAIKEYSQTFIMLLDKHTPLKIKTHQTLKVTTLVHG